MHVDEDELEAYIEIRSIYDGWSVAKMKDGRLINRWPESDWRYEQTQQWIERFKAAR